MMPTSSHAAPTSLRPCTETGPRRTLVENHLDLVDAVVAKMAARFPSHIDRSELTSAGLLGLVEAAARFEPERGIPFGPYAQRRISGAILDSCRSSDWAPRSVRASARLADSTERGIASQLGRTPTPEELASAMGVTIDDLHRLRELVQRGRVESLDVNANDDLASRVSLHDMQRGDPATALEVVEQIAYLHDAVAALPDRHRTVIVGSYFDDRTDRDLALALEVSLSRISQLRADALEMLGDGLQAQYEPASAEPPTGRVALRKARYAAAIARSSSHRSRVSTALAC